MYETFSTEYDHFVNWKARLAVELPFLEQQLHDAGARRVLDAACGTGMHAIALAERGFITSGSDISAGMVNQARHNAAEKDIQVEFMNVGFGGLTKAFGQSSFDALLCLGNSLPHLLTHEDLDRALDDFASCLRPDGLLILQDRNFDAVLAHNSRWMEPQGMHEGDREWLFLRFYDFDPGGMLIFNIVTLKRQGLEEWKQEVRSTRLRAISQVELSAALESAGFEDLQLYGDMSGQPFDIETSENLIITARRA